MEFCSGRPLRHRTRRTTTPLLGRELALDRGRHRLGLAVLAGWQYWQQNRNSRRPSRTRRPTRASSTARQRTKDEATKADGAARTAPQVAYADQADLALARAAVDARDFATAAKRLRTVADGSRDPQLRLMRAIAARPGAERAGQARRGAQAAGCAKAGAFTALFHDARGDVLAAKGDVAAAAGLRRGARTQSARQRVGVRSRSSN
jgi:predicted negative regulator of RcsB-dependent stress response